MSKEDIIEGLKVAVNKGESLNKAMVSFYNSGYPKEDIEASARELASSGPLVTSPITAKPSTPSTTSTPLTSQSDSIPKTSFLGKIFKKSESAQLQPVQYQKFQPTQVKLQPVYSSVKQEETEKETSFNKAKNKESYSDEEAVYQESYSGENSAYQEFPSLKQPETVQKVSKYGVKPSPVGAVVVFILVFFLLFLIGVLVFIFLFKDKLTVFFNSFVDFLAIL